MESFVLSKINVIGSNKYQMCIYIKLEPFIFSLWLILKNCAEINLIKTHHWWLAESRLNGCFCLYFGGVGTYE